MTDRIFRFFSMGTFFLFTFSGWGDSAIQPKAVPGTFRVFSTGTVEGSDTVEIFCAKNETESFQVAITAKDSPLRRVHASLDSLKNEKNEVIPKEGIVLYRVIDVPVRNSAPRATEPPGLYPDPLVPFVDPYSGEELKGPRWSEESGTAIRFGGNDFDLWPNRIETVWVDISVPESVKAGLYQGELRITTREGNEARIPVRLTVWDFSLPHGPTLENHFGGFSYLAGYYGIQRNSDRYRLLEDRYIAMMAQHRINPPIPSRLLPKPLEDGSIQADENTARALADFIETYHVTNIEIPHAPFSDSLGKDREKAIRFYRSWYAFLESRGWEKRAYHYMLDEPNTPEAYEQVRQLGALVKEAEPRIRRLVVEQPYLQNPDWGSLDDAIDIWCPLFSFIHRPSVQKMIAAGDAVWSYSALVQSAPGYHPDYESVKNDNPPYWQIDFPILSYRIAPWLNYRYGVTGLLYWSTVYWQSPKRNPWDDPGFRVRFNGDGFLFYPGEDAGIEGPIASIRLKSLRDGMEDYEYFVLLSQRGGEETARDIVRQCVPTWGSWDSDPMRILERRKQLAAEILKRKS